MAETNVNQLFDINRLLVTALLRSVVCCFVLHDHYQFMVVLRCYYFFKLRYSVTMVTANDVTDKTVEYGNAVKPHCLILSGST